MRRLAPLSFELHAGIDAPDRSLVAAVLKLGLLAPLDAAMTHHERPGPTRVVVRRGAAEHTFEGDALDGALDDALVVALESLAEPSELARMAAEASFDYARAISLSRAADAMLRGSNLAEAAAVVLSAATAGHGLGFHRAALFVPERQSATFVGLRAVGPDDEAEAHRVWESIEERRVAFDRDFEKSDAKSAFDKRVRSMRIEPSDRAGDEVRAALRGEESVFARPTGVNSKDLATLDPAAHFVLARLGSRERPLALLYADLRYGPSQDLDALREPLEAFVAHASAAWETLKLLRENEDLARHDPLTGLWNRRELEARLAHERSRAQRDKAALSLLLMDLDLFREVNNTQGHEAGDALLRTIGAILRQELRAHDLAARFGGDELAVVLPGAGSFEAASVARRIGVAAHKKGISLSIGVSAFPDDCDHPDDLVPVADKNLYAAKAAGRGRAQLAEHDDPIVFADEDA